MSGEKENLDLARWIPVELDEPVLDGFVEPWHPEPGQRVRVRLSGECRVVTAHVDIQGSLHRKGAGHPPEIDGATGTVRDAAYMIRLGFPKDAVLTDATGHPYFVLLDRQIAVEGLPAPVGAARLAAIEIEPLEDDELWINGEKIPTRGPIIIEGLPYP